MIRIASAALAASLALSAFGAAQSQTRSLAADVAPAKVSIDQFKGLAGDWAGPQGDAGFSGPVGGEIVGHLLVTDGKTPAGARLEELWVFRQEGDSVVMHQKLFTADLKGRQEKDDWEARKTVAIDQGHIYLDNMTVTPGADTLQLTVRTGGGQNGAPATYFTMDFKRVK